MSGSEQFEFVFSEGSPGAQGAMPWRAEWMRAAEALCRRLAVPLNHRAEVRLIQGPILRGWLCLAHERLEQDGNRDRLVLRIGQTTFRLGEMESVLRLDDDTGAADKPGETPAPLEPEA